MVGSRAAILIQRYAVPILDQWYSWAMLKSIRKSKVMPSSYSMLKTRLEMKQRYVLTQPSLQRTDAEIFYSRTRNQMLISSQSFRKPQVQPLPLSRANRLTNFLQRRTSQTPVPPPLTYHSLSMYSTPTKIPKRGRSKNLRTPTSTTSSPSNTP